MLKRFLSFISTILILFVVLSLISCNKKKEETTDNRRINELLPEKGEVKIKNVESITVEQAIVNGLDKLGISQKEIKKVVKEDGIYFYIPLVEDKLDLEFADMVIAGQLEGTGTQMANIIREENAKIIREYFDTVHHQSYIIEIYYNTVKPGFQPAEKTNDKPELSIVIDDFGNYDGPLLDSYCQLDPAITFAVIPGLSFSKTVMRKATESGHEVIIHIPMEPEDPSVNPGKNALLSSMSDEEIASHLKEFFEELPLIVGVNQHMGSKMTENKDKMSFFLNFIKKKEVFFIDSKTSSKSVAYKVAKQLRVPSAQRDLFLDAPANTNEVLDLRIKDLIRLRDKNGKALVITHCHDKSRLDRLKQFMTEAEKLGFRLVPASAYVSTEITF